MAATLTSYSVDIPLESLPIAAAALDGRGRILSANPRFRRLFGSLERPDLPRRLTHLVSESDRAAVRQAIDEMTRFEEKAPFKCTLRVVRRKAPALPLALTLSELGPRSPIPYLVCVEAIARRRRADREPLPVTPPLSYGRRDSSEALRSPMTESALHERQPPRLSFMTLSNEVRWPLEAIKRWESFAATGAIEVYALTGGVGDASTFVVRLPTGARGESRVSGDQTSLDAAAIVFGTA